MSQTNETATVLKTFHFSQTRPKCKFAHSRTRPVPAPTRPRRRPRPVDPQPPCRATASSPAGKRATCHCPARHSSSPARPPPPVASRTAPTLHTPGGAGDPCGCGLGASAVRGPSLWVTDYRSLERSTGGPRTAATRFSLGGGAASRRHRDSTSSERVAAAPSAVFFCSRQPAPPPAPPRPPRSPGSAPTLASSSQAGTGRCRLNRCHLQVLTHFDLICQAERRVLCKGHSEFDARKARHTAYITAQSCSSR